MTFWALVKKYWGIAVLVVATVLGYIFFHKGQVNFTDQLKKIQDIHDEELKKIQAAREEEAKLHLENEKKLKEALVVIQQHYDEAKETLDTKKKKEVETLVTQYSDQPDVLAKKLSDATGFRIILPT